MVGMSNLDDIAQKAGVSRVTVSKVINNYDTVAAKTRDKVFKVIESMNLEITDLKRTKDNTMMIGMVMPLGGNAINNFSMDILAGAEEKAFEKDYFIVIGDSKANMTREEQVASKMLNRDLDGIILYSITGEDKKGKHLDFLAKSKIPTVLVDLKIEGFPANIVQGDNFKGATTLMNHLFSLGHKDIATFVPQRMQSTYKDRHRGYQFSMMERGISLKEDYLVQIKTPNEIYAKTKLLLEAENRPTAFFVLAQYILIPMLQAIKDLHLRIPEDISIVAFDSDYAKLPAEYEGFFTSITQSGKLMGRLAVELLCQQMEDPNSTNQEILIPGKLDIRASTGSPASAN
jgi:DNA-binding LacI/PurR family transcriptional regulator